MNVDGNTTSVYVKDAVSFGLLAAMMVSGMSGMMLAYESLMVMITDQSYALQDGVLTGVVTLGVISAIAIRMIGKRLNV
jgi:hypothetical protein